MPLDTRPEFHRARVIAGPHGLVAHSTNVRRSSRIAGLSGANGLVIIPPKSESGKSAIGKGEWAEAILIGEIQV
jgi:gephyrin